MSRLEKALAAAVTDLQRAGAECALVGGLAVSARAEPRFTRDVDLAVTAASDCEAERVVTKLLGIGYRVLSQVEQEATGRLATVRLAPPGLGDNDLVVDLLFASSGIEPEIVAAATHLRITATLSLSVASTPHLIALKILSRDDASRPQDRADLAALLQVVTEDDLRASRAALELIDSRGYARGRRLVAALQDLVQELGVSDG